MTTICPFAEWRPLPEATSQPPITPRTVIFHTAVGTLRGVERFFRESTGIESHMMVGGPWDGPELDGVIWQWMDLERQADANLDANGFAISVETSDNAPLSADDLVPWSAKQLASLVRFGNWAADTFSIPRRQCPTWDQGGFGWHAMWGAPSHWTPVAGKVCPGAARIRQLQTIVFPAIFAGRNLEEDDLPFTEEKLRAIVNSEATEVIRLATRGSKDLPAFGYFAPLAGNVAATKTAVDQLADDEVNLTERLNRLSAQVSSLTRLVEALMLGTMSGDLTVTGALHVESPPPPPPPGGST